MTFPSHKENQHEKPGCDARCRVDGVRLWLQLIAVEQLVHEPERRLAVVQRLLDHEL
jgi:hypothetical protein